MTAQFAPRRDKILHHRYKGFFKSLAVILGNVQRIHGTFEISTRLFRAEVIQTACKRLKTSALVFIRFLDERGGNIFVECPLVRRFIARRLRDVKEVLQTAVVGYGDTACSSLDLPAEFLPSVVVGYHNGVGICAVYRHTLSRGQLKEFAREFEIFRKRRLVGKETFRDFLVIFKHTVNSCH